MAGPQALIFDCDGVLADTERYGHLVAFNQMFAEFGLPVRWSDADYQAKLAIGGGKERLASLLTPQFAAQAGLPADPAAQQAAVARVARAQDPDLHRPGRRGRGPAPAGRRPGRGRGTRRRLAGGGRLHLGARVGARPP